MTTNEKESYSLQIIKTNDLIHKFFPNAIKLEHVTDKERQLAGIDLITLLKLDHQLNLSISMSNVIMKKIFPIRV